MRQAADILSSAPAMQIRYLDAMQAMAKSANSKVIFMPGSSSNMSKMSMGDTAVESNSRELEANTEWQNTINSKILETM